MGRLIPAGTGFECRFFAPSWLRQERILRTAEESGRQSGFPTFGVALLVPVLASTWLIKVISSAFRC